MNNLEKNAKMSNLYMKVAQAILSATIIGFSYSSLFIVSQTLSEPNPISDTNSQRKKIVNHTSSNGEEVTSCEQSIHIFDQSLYLALQDESSLIIVIRPGKDEKKKVASVRMSILENLCQARNNKHSCIIATGTQTDGLGSANFYVKGNLYDVAYYEKNTSSFCHRP